jgi:hypothetical protein
MREAQSLMSRYHSEVGSASEGEIQAMDAWRHEYYNHQISQGLDENEALQETQRAEGAYFRQCWESGVSGPQGFLSAYGESLGLTNSVNSDKDSQHESEAPSPEQSEQVPRGKVPRSVQQHRARIQNAPDGGPRGRAPAESGDIFKAMARRVNAISDDELIRWYRKLESQGMDRKEIDQRLEEAAQDLQGQSDA